MARDEEQAVAKVEEPLPVKSVKSWTSMTRKNLPDLRLKNHQIDVIREARFRATALEGVGKGGCLPPLALNGRERPRQFVFDKIKNRGFVEKIENRLISEMKNQLAEMLK